MTLDVDLVLELSPIRISDLLEAFPAEFFCCPPPDVIAHEISRERRGHFNIIHMETGFKGDLYPLGRDELHLWGMAHRRAVELGGESVMLAPPEYVIIRKLEYFREGGSEKHMRDIAGMLLVRNAAIDQGVIQEWAARLCLEGEWEEVKRRVAKLPGWRL
ncbi:MAG: hypothetical protein R6X19_05340 [Kiritimatiellia bacterium]